MGHDSEAGGGQEPFATEGRNDLRRPERRRLGVANAVPIGVPFDRDIVGRLLEMRREEVGAASGRDLSDAEEWQIVSNAGCGAAPVLWVPEEGRGERRHLLASGDGWQTGLLRDTLLKHAEENPEFWRGSLLETEAEQVRALSDGSLWPLRGLDPRRLVILDNPESQEVLALLAEFMDDAERGSRVHVVVLTKTPAAMPSTLMRGFGYRVCFRGTRSDSRDMVGDETAATLPELEHGDYAAVVYQEEYSHHPERGVYREDLPGRRHGRRLDVYAGYPPEKPQ